MSAWLIIAQAAVKGVSLFLIAAIAIRRHQFGYAAGFATALFFTTHAALDELGQDPVPSREAAGGAVLVAALVLLVVLWRRPELWTRRRSSATSR